MGCWIRAKGRLEVLPPPDEELMMEFWCFGEMECPEEYLVRGERFLNVWFFDENNRLACEAGKFAEPSIWIKFLKKEFFEPRGYQVIGDLDIIGEGEPGVFDQKIIDEYWLWRRRVADLIAKKISENN